MWRERLVRLILVGVVGLGVVWLVKSLAHNPDFLGQGVKLPSISLEGLDSSQILGSVQEEMGGEKTEGEVEPIAEPVTNIQAQTNSLFEAIKKLPSDQMEAVKEQLFKEFCEDYCQERREGE